MTLPAFPPRRSPTRLLPSGRRSWPTESEFSSAAFASLARRRWKTILGSLVVAVGLASAYTLFVRPVYESTSVLRFETEQVNLPQLVRELSTENRISTEVEVLRGRKPAQTVIDALGLRARLKSPRQAQISDLFMSLEIPPTADSTTLIIHPVLDHQVATSAAPGEVVAAVGEIVRLPSATFALSPLALDEREIRLAIVPAEDAVRDFDDDLNVSRPARDADLIAIRFRSNDRRLAAATANALADHVINERRTAQLARTGSTVRFLSLQLDTLRRELQRSEDTLRVYRERAGVVDNEESARTQVQRLARIEADRGAVKAERDALAALLRQVRVDTSNTGDAESPTRKLMSFPTLFRNQAASELLGALARVENERAQLLVRRLPADPDIQVLDARIKELEGQLQEIGKTYLQGLSNQVASLDDVAKGFGVELDRLPAKEVRAARLEREVQVNRELYTLIQTRLKEAEMTQAVGDPTIRVVDSAVVANRPIRPKPLLNLVLATLGGGLFGLVLAVRRQFTDRLVRSREDVIAAAGLPVLGVMPRANQTNRPRALTLVNQLTSTARALRLGRRKGPLVPTQSNGTAAANRIATLLVGGPETALAYAESFNRLYANVSLTGRDQPIRSIMFTSPLPGEGKTLTAVNFAMTVARRGFRVLLIDADLNRGRVSEVFGAPREPGLAEALAGTREWRESAFDVPVTGTGSLTVLPPGERPESTGKWISPDRIRELLDTVALDFDTIVLDAPPVNVLTDATLMSAAADAVLLVVRAGHTAADAIQYATEQLAAARAHVMGAVLNDIDLRRNGESDGSYLYLAEVERYHVSRH